MPHAKRVSIAGLMGIVLVASLGLAAFRRANETLAFLIFVATCGVQLLAVVGAVCREKRERAWWLGFALFGWGYLALAFWGPSDTQRLATRTMVECFRVDAGAPVQPQAAMGGWWMEGGHPEHRVGHSLWSLVIAALGGMLARAFFGGDGNPPESDDAVSRRASWIRWREWVQSVMLGLAGFFMVATAAVVALRWAPVVWAGAMLVFTWGVIGVAILGAVANRGRRRLRWLGAALFGAGYMILIFNPETCEPNAPHRMIVDSLRSVLPWLPPTEPGYPLSSPEMAAANARIRKALEQPVSLHFPVETPLHDFLASVVANARCADGREITVYVDPVGLQEAEKTLDSPVQLDFDRVPLKTGLNLALRQVGLVYEIREGLLEINSGGACSLPYLEDPLLSVAHCLLALGAAGVGSAAGLVIGGARE